MNIKVVEDLVREKNNPVLVASIPLFIVTLSIAFLSQAFGGFWVIAAVACDTTWIFIGGVIVGRGEPTA